MTTCVLGPAVGLNAEPTLANRHLAGDFAIDTGREVQAAITQLLDGAWFMDSTGVALLARGYQHARTRGVELGGLANPDGRVAYILQMTGVDRIISARTPPRD